MLACSQDGRVMIHPSSVNHEKNFPSQWFVYYEKVEGLVLCHPLSPFPLYLSPLLLCLNSSLIDASFPSLPPSLPLSLQLASTHPHHLTLHTSFPLTSGLIWPAQSHLMCVFIQSSWHSLLLIETDKQTNRQTDTDRQEGRKEGGVACILLLRSFCVSLCFSVVRSVCI